jgi:hypothetical protein
MANQITITKMERKWLGDGMKFVATFTENGIEKNAVQTGWAIWVYGDFTYPSTEIQSTLDAAIAVEWIQTMGWK